MGSDINLCNKQSSKVNSLWIFQSIKNMCWRIRKKSFKWQVLCSAEIDAALGKKNRLSTNCQWLFCGEYAALFGILSAQHQFGHLAPFLPMNFQWPYGPIFTAPIKLVAAPRSPARWCHAPTAAMRRDTSKSRSGHQKLLTRKSRKSSSQSRRLMQFLFQVRLKTYTFENLLKLENAETENS